MLCGCTPVHIPDRKFAWGRHSDAQCMVQFRGYAIKCVIMLLGGQVVVVSTVCIIPCMEARLVELSYKPMKIGEVDAFPSLPYQNVWLASHLHPVPRSNRTVGADHTVHNTPCTGTNPT